MGVAGLGPDRFERDSQGFQDTLRDVLRAIVMFYPDAHQWMLRSFGKPNSDPRQDLIECRPIRQVEGRVNASGPSASLSVTPS